MYISIKLHIQNVYSLIFYIGYLKIRHLTRDSFIDEFFGQFEISFPRKSREKSLFIVFFLFFAIFCNHISLQLYFNFSYSKFCLKLIKKYNTVIFHLFHRNLTCKNSLILLKQKKNHCFKIRKKIIKFC